MILNREVASLKAVHGAALEHCKAEHETQMARVKAAHHAAMEAIHAAHADALRSAAEGQQGAVEAGRQVCRMLCR